MRLQTFAAFLVLALPAGAFAQDAATPPAALRPPLRRRRNPAAPIGDAARGKPLTYTCQGCHGITGYKNAYPNYHVPRDRRAVSAVPDQCADGVPLRGAQAPDDAGAGAELLEQDIADIAAYLPEWTSEPRHDEDHSRHRAVRSPSPPAATPTTSRPSIRRRTVRRPHQFVLRPARGPRRRRQAAGRSQGKATGQACVDCHGAEGNAPIDAVTRRSAASTTTTSRTRCSCTATATVPAARPRT